MSINKNKILLLITALILSANVLAHKGATGIVKQRMDSMSEMGDAMKVMADMIKGKTNFDEAVVRRSASVLAEHSRTILDYFPNTKDSQSSKESDALPVIWASWDRFSKLSNKLEIAVETLQEVSSKEFDKRSLRLAFAKTAKACSSCHDDFRKPED